MLSSFHDACNWEKVILEGHMYCGGQATVQCSSGNTTCTPGHKNEQGEIDNDFGWARSADRCRIAMVVGISLMEDWNIGGELASLDQFETRRILKYA